MTGGRDQGARDHGGGLDAAVARWGGHRSDWLDLSTGINPVPYPATFVPDTAWTDLPDTAALTRLESAARRFWRVPDHLDVLAAPGASVLIAQMPGLAGAPGTVRIDKPTYNEHAAAFAAAGWSLVAGQADVRVVVHPNNPTGVFWEDEGAQGLLIVDESFCDVAPDRSLIRRAGSDCLILKSFGKFWGLAGLRLGFLIGGVDRVARMRSALGPWLVSGPALAIGARALEDDGWAGTTRTRLTQDANRLDRLMTGHGAGLVGGTPLFRLYAVDDATAWQDRLGRGRVLGRIFPYSGTWLRLGLPHPDRWSQIEAAL